MSEDPPIVSLPADRQPTLRVVPMPADANVHGDVFGGWIMAQVDIAGSIPAASRAQGRVATIAVNSFLFKQPVFVGDVLSFYAGIFAPLILQPLCGPFVVFTAKGRKHQCIGFRIF